MLRPEYAIGNVEDIYANYARLRETPPGHIDDELGCFLAARYDDVYEILKNHEDFSSNRSIALKKTSIKDGLRTILLSDDPPRHRQIRNLVNRWFTTHSIASLRPWVEGVAGELFDSIENSATDFAAQVAEPLPVMTIAKLLGVDPADWRQLKHWSLVASGLAGADPRAHAREITSFYGYFGRVMQERRATPMNDLISKMLEQNKIDNLLNDVDLKAFCVLLLTSGNETTTNLMCNLVDILSKRADVWHGLKDGKLSISTVVEEALRYESPIQLISRVAVRPKSLNGWEFNPGDPVAICMGAANRDPLEFPDPDTFDPTRDHSQHLGFGHGIHFCIGSALAKMETEILLTQMLSRYAEVRSTGRGKRIQSRIVRGFVTLPMEFQDA